MPSTSNPTLTSPAYTDAPDGPAQFLTLAQQIHDLLADTGWVSSLTDILTPQTNWAIATGQYRVKAGVLTALGRLTYSGSTITANAAGDITNQNMVLLGSAYRPPQTMPVPLGLGTGATSAVGNLASGMLALSMLPPASTFASGGQVDFFLTYPI